MHPVRLQETDEHQGRGTSDQHLSAALTMKHCWQCVAGAWHGAPWRASCVPHFQILPLGSVTRRQVAFALRNPNPTHPLHPSQPDSQHRSRGLRSIPGHPFLGLARTQPTPSMLSSYSMMAASALGGSPKWTSRFSCSFQNDHSSRAS